MGDHIHRPPVRLRRHHRPGGAVRRRCSTVESLNGAYLTLSSDGAAEAAKILGARAVIPVHFEGWSHFTQGADALHAAFAGNGITDRRVLAARGETVRVQRPPGTRLPTLASASVKFDEDRSCGGTRAAHARAKAGHR